MSLKSECKEQACMSMILTRGLTIGVVAGSGSRVAGVGSWTIVDDPCACDLAASNITSFW